MTNSGPWKPLSSRVFSPLADTGRGTKMQAKTMEMAPVIGSVLGRKFTAMRCFSLTCWSYTLLLILHWSYPIKSAKSRRPIYDPNPCRKHSESRAAFAGASRCGSGTVRTGPQSSNLRAWPKGSVCSRPADPGGSAAPLAPSPSAERSAASEETGDQNARFGEALSSGPRGTDGGENLEDASPQ